VSIAPTFAAVIAHADDAEMLQRCVVHHLSIGVDYVFISLNVDDEPSARIAAVLASDNVRVARLDDYSADPLDYFTAAKEVVEGWKNPDWIVFVDSDEFWIPACGHIAGTSGLAANDAFSVPRFNAPPILTRAGTIRDIRVDDPGLVVVGTRQQIDAQFMAKHPDTPWINAAIGPKLLVRPGSVAVVALGAHEFVPRGPQPRTTVPPDLLIVHLPFTTSERFYRKVRAVRAMLAAHGHRFQGQQGWHWRRWLAVEDAGELGAEFAGQVIEEDDLDELTARGVLTTPAGLFANARAAR
jgi:hypothetical protein